MKLFSKRYNSLTERLRNPYYKKEAGEDKFIEQSLRRRLQEEIKFITEKNEFLERFIVFFDYRKNKFQLNDDSLREFSTRELGYDINNVIDVSFENFKRGEYSDKYLFDLIEMLIIFCKKEKREELIRRFQFIFSEENSTYMLHKYMVFVKGFTGLKSIIPLIKDELLSKKLEEFFDTKYNLKFDILAKVSAEIVQHIFSSPKGKKDTKSYSEKVCREVASKWTDKKNEAVLASLLNDVVKNIKSLNNQVSNIRHTDKNTIPIIDNPNLYKLITYKNIAIAELVILSIPEDYISEKDPEVLKNNYLDKYSIDKTTEWFLGKPKEEIPTINLDDDNEVRIEDVPF